METFSAYNKKIDGYTDVLQTVKLLEKIAASNLHLIQQQALSLESYTQNVLVILQSLPHCLTLHTGNVPTETGKQLLVIFTGDKGLVGDLWQRQFALLKNSPAHTILVVGKEGEKLLQKGDSVTIKHHHFIQRIPTDEELKNFTSLLKSYTTSGAYQSVSALHIKTNSLTDQEPIISRLLPLPQDTILTTTPQTGFPIIEGAHSTIEDMLFEKYLQSKIKQLILETAISEYSARTVTTEHASSQTTKEINSLQHLYIKDRRRSETQKQLERFSANISTS